MVVIFFPATLEIGVMQERVASPLMWTVQAPQRAMPQPNLVPVMFKVSRRTQRSGISGLTSTVWGFPLRVKVVAISPPSGRAISYNKPRFAGKPRASCVTALLGDWVGLIDLGGAGILPRSLHCATRRTKNVRKKNPGRFGRDDRKKHVQLHVVFSIWLMGGLLHPVQN